MMAAGRQVVLCPSVESFLTQCGDLYLLPPTGQEQQFVPAPYGEPLLRALRSMETMEADTPLDTVLATIGDDDTREMVGLAIEQLLERGCAVDRERAYSHDATLRPYDRQMRYMAQCGLDVTQAQRAIAETRVLVVGLGGLGGAAAEALLRMGVGTLVGVDFDVVERENLHRQTLYTRDDVGRPKTEVALGQLRRCNPDATIAVDHCKVTGADDLRALFDKHDPTIVVSAADYPPIAFKHWMDDAAFERGLPVIFGGHRPPHVFAGPFIVPGKSPCFRCFKWHPDRALRPELMDELDEVRDRHGFIVPGLGFLDLAVAGLIVNDLFAYITGASEPKLIEHEVGIDLRTYASEPIEFGRDGCERCRTAGALYDAA